MFNITNINNQSVSIAKALLIFYIVMANNESSLLGKQTQTFLRDNRLAQHVVAFALMVVIVNLIGGIQETDKLLFYSTLSYVWFIFTTKLDIQFNVILMMLLMLWFFYENKEAGRHAIMERDTLIDGYAKKKIMADYRDWNVYGVSGLILLTLAGTYLYADRKGVQYGGGKFDPIKFLFY